MNRTRTVLAAAAALATLAAPLTALPAAAAAPAITKAKAAKPKAKPKKVTVRNLITAERGSIVFSPNGDKFLERARVSYTLKRKSVVTVTITRVNDGTDESKTVLTKKLGKVSRGTHKFTWNGKKKRGGKVLRDGHYLIAFTADPVKKHIKKGYVYVHEYLDTRYQPERLEPKSTTIYPSTTVITDQIGFNHGGSHKDWRSERIDTAALVVKDAAGNTVRTQQPQDYGPDYVQYPVAWDGRDDNGAVLPAGQYTVQMRVTDWAGNSGVSPDITVTVSAVPLVLASGSRALTPASGALPPAPATSAEKVRQLESRAGDDRSSANGGDDSPTQPCGVVFASDIYPAPGASFRSRSNCGWAINHAIGGGSLMMPELNAPRGLHTAQMTMRGRPTFDGEADAAQLSFQFLYDNSGDTATTPAAPGEAMTSTKVAENPWNPSTATQPTGVSWTIRTVGFDSYDVADLKVDFTYLTPQS
jgi:flagellar hook assembly protein FlgD